MKATNFQEVYLQFGVYKEDTLFYAYGGNFASKAWTTSDEAFRQVLGEKFDAITGDDGGLYNINKHAIRRLKDEEEFNSLLANCSPAFKLAIEIEGLNVSTRNWLKKRMLLDGLPKLIEEFGYEEVRKYALELLGKV